MPTRRTVTALVASCCFAIFLHSQAQPVEPSPSDLLRTFKTIYVKSQTVYIKKGVMEGALYAELERKHLQDSGIAVKTDSSADTVLSIERQGVWPQWDYSYRLDHPASGIVLTAGKVKAIDGGSAAKQIAEKVVQRIADARSSANKNQEPGKQDKAKPDASTPGSPSESH